MANQLKMAEVQAILALARLGRSGRQIARELGVDRGAVGRYLRLWAQGDSKPASAPTGSGVPTDSKSASAPTGSTPSPDDAEDVGIGSGSARSEGASLGLISSAAGSAAGAWREVIVHKLDAGLTAQRIYQDLCADHGYA